MFINIQWLLRDFSGKLLTSTLIFKFQLSFIFQMFSRSLLVEEMDVVQNSQLVLQRKLVQFFFHNRLFCLKLCEDTSVNFWWNCKLSWCRCHQVDPIIFFLWNTFETENKKEDLWISTILFSVLLFFLPKLSRFVQWSNGQHSFWLFL